MFLRTFVKGDLSDACLVITLGLCMRFFGGKATKVKCHFYHIISRVRTINMTYTVVVNLDHLAAIVKDLFKALSVCEEKRVKLGEKKIHKQIRQDSSL